MSKGIIKLSLLSIIICAVVGISLYMSYGKMYHAVPTTITRNSNYWLTVILLPLDSRPPCTQFVEQLAHMAGIKLLIPEPELLDNYKSLANKQELRIWLTQVSKQADAAIISTDMLIHGGLLASRLSSGTTDDTKEVLHLLTRVHQENPQLKMYVFSIIPRLLIADNKENIIFQKDMLKYSVLKDQVYTFENAEDIKKIRSVEKQIPDTIINRYTAMYENNSKLNKTLMDMVESGVLAGLVVGQDDGQPFGIPNINKQQLQYQLLQTPLSANKVFITRGTDEVALTLLGHIVMEFSNEHPKVFVTYSTADAGQITMPFMPHTVAKTVQEKLKIAGAIEVQNTDEADFVLYVHIGNQNTKSDLIPAAKEVKKLLDQGYKVALVDLTENFNISETLLPILIKQDVAIPKLIAYAGWNTTSNSIGTAVTQACIFSKAVSKPTSLSNTMGLYKENLEFLTARFLDDLYYQKEINPYINKELQRLHIDPYNLGTAYYQTNYKIQRMMISKGVHLFREGLFNKPITINSTQGAQEIIITDLELQTYLPWQRTFEIWAQPTLSLAYIEP
ncbi:DUF4127 family protein [Pelosinus sp. IPA-1]|uniref:DUF4127 family protein n=1 Tax=Pelosinus sp. IPA-1 TaxID=3029569 RepID=UPI002436160C|nr:DUF4127 family protein [Pelosinus sp. IPA-1]GMA99283.1 hypothetical protein PIPA1_20830 [Pelosinus sp. IPA-1]